MPYKQKQQKGYGASKLSHYCHTSAEVVRRALELVEKQTEATEGAGALLRRLHETGDLLARDVAEEYLAEVREDRESWRTSE